MRYGQIRRGYLGGGGELPAEGIDGTCAWKIGACAGGHPLHLCGGSVRADDRDFVWPDGLSDPAFWTVWGVFHGGRIHGAWRDVCGGRLCGSCTHRDLEPFCERGKTVPLSTGIRQSETGVGDLDGYGKRGIYPRDEKIRY
ncbi:unknown [Roseburia sp. CAG:182]|nr:unknown [Roseburia sp. CAG:182]